MKTVWLMVIIFAALVATGGAGDDRRITINRHEKKTEFRIGKELVTTYHTDARQAKPYFWPLNAPGEIALTRSVPNEGGDHSHQKSAWFGHGDVIPVGLDLKAKIKGVAGVDFWTEQPGHGVIVCKEIGPPQTGDGRAAIETQNEWRTIDGRPILSDKRIIEVHDLDRARLIVVNMELRATQHQIDFGDTKEGAFGVRVRDELTAANGTGKITNADGKTGELSCWGRRSDWCDYSGTVNGKAVGVALFDDPTNRFRACWHVRSYGLMAANPFGRVKAGFPGVVEREAVTLKKGETLRLRYGILLHTGDARSGNVAECFQRFSKMN